MELGKPYAFPMGRSLVRDNNDAEGIGYDKKQTSACNRLNRGSKFASTWKGADLSPVFDCVNEGKPMNARNSITSEDEKLANKQLKNQWDNTDWKEVEKLLTIIKRWYYYIRFDPLNPKTPSAWSHKAHPSPPTDPRRRRHWQDHNNHRQDRLHGRKGKHWLLPILTQLHCH